MSNKCPMCDRDEVEHNEVLRVLQAFENRRLASEMVLVTTDEPGFQKLAREDIAASDLYRKLKTR